MLQKKMLSKITKFTSGTSHHVAALLRARAKTLAAMTLHENNSTISITVMCNYFALW